MVIEPEQQFSMNFFQVCLCNCESAMVVSRRFGEALTALETQWKRLEAFGSGAPLRPQAGQSSISASRLATTLLHWGCLSRVCILYTYHTYTNRRTEREPRAKCAAARRAEGTRRVVRVLGCDDCTCVAVTSRCGATRNPQFAIHPCITLSSRYVRRFGRFGRFGRLRDDWFVSYTRTWK